MDSISHVIVIFESGRIRHWQDTVTAVADVYSVNRHALGNAVTALQYEVLYESLHGSPLPEDKRPSQQMLLRAIGVATGAETAVIEEWLEMLRDTVRGAAEPEDGPPAFAGVAPV